MFTLLTTANFPDVMMGVYHDNSFSCIFFIVYLLFGMPTHVEATMMLGATRAICLTRARYRCVMCARIRGR